MRRGFLIAMIVTTGCSASPPAPPPVPADHAATVQAWRDKHEVDYRRDWVSIAGLYFLSPGRHTIGSDRKSNIVLGPHAAAQLGTVVAGADGAVRFEAAPKIIVTQKDVILRNPIVMKEVGKPPTADINIGDIRLVVHESGDRLSLRIRDPQGELAQGFLGFTWFPIDPAYRVVGKFIKDAEPKKLQVLNTFNDIDTYSTEGVVEFTLQGQTLRLRPFTTRPKRFYFVFRDASGGHETYKTARFFYSDLLDDGSVVLDFNEAYNPPCAFNPYTTCPIPLKENIVPIKILAGEKAYPLEVKFPK
ncbi:MAG TPA: DUF1684 domain-containing protein [Vicinamibacterales bacterium]|nr:DUF1684 domain-containing protein [Vicinamibacterales bacterium]